MRQLLRWLDDNIIFLLSAFLLVFIPLYPKLPLFDVIQGYIVRVRLEDFLVLGTTFVWFVQLLRKKITLNDNPLVKPILTYLAIGMLSMLSAIFITKTVPLEWLHINKMVLHYLRRIEYFSLFFIFFASIKSLKHFKIFLILLLLTVSAVTLYGYGQKYLYWPAFSTMNREFSKGWALYLTQNARVLSTFGGHYDLAAYAMAMLIILWALFFSLEKIYLRILTMIVLAGTFWLLILTASRTSFIAYIIGISVLFFFWSFSKGMPWSGTRWLTVVSLSIFVMLTFGDLSDRFAKLLKLDQRFYGVKTLLLRPFGKPPSGDQIVLLENNLESVTSKSDFPLLPTKPTDVFDEIPQGFIATESATSGATIIQIPRSYSKTARIYDLSTGIRLDALWPRAIAGFKRNPLLGSGYSTLTKTTVQEFTEAESTDNDYLRALGETGILGFLTFGWILATIVIIVWRVFIKTKDQLLLGFIISMAAVVVGLLVNAVYIDIFEASKVAFTFWALVGIVLGSIKLLKLDTGNIQSISPWKYNQENFIYLKNIITRIIKSDKTYLILIIILAYLLRQYKIKEPLADWHSWRQADTSAVTRNYVKYGIDLFYPRYDDLSSVASGQANPEGYRFVEFPIYNVLSYIVDKLFPESVEYAGRLTSTFASLGTLTFLYLLVKKYYGYRIAFLTVFFFCILPYNIFWSRVILPEPTLTFFTTGMLFFFDLWISNNLFKYWLLSVLFVMSALLIKFTTVFFIFPLGYLAWKKWKLSLFKQPLIWIYLFLAVIPFLLWRWHISRYPEGIPAYLWLFNGDNIRFKGAFFWWLFAERFDKLILGGWGVILVCFGIIRKFKSGYITEISYNTSQKFGTTYLFHAWLIGILVYLFVFATGNVTHDYYQIILVPILSIFLAIGADFLLLKSNENISPLLSKLLLGVIVLFMIAFGWYQVRDLYNINHPEIVIAGGEFQKLIDNEKVRVIAPYNGDTAFLYQTGRRGWPIMEGSIDDMIKKGAHYYISTTFDDLTNDLIIQAKTNQNPKQSFKLIRQTNLYVIIQLVPDKDLPKKL